MKITVVGAAVIVGAVVLAVVVIGALGDRPRSTSEAS